MRAISAEKCITESKQELQSLFEFVENNATEFKAYAMEKSILKKILKIQEKFLLPFANPL